MTGIKKKLAGHLFLLTVACFTLLLLNYKTLKGIVSGLTATGWLAVAGAIVILLILAASSVLMFAIKKSVLESRPEFQRVDLEQVLNIDYSAFSSYTGQLELLGFERIGDYSLILMQQATAPVHAAAYSPGLPPRPVQPAKPGTSGFARLFVHREAGCFGEINQTIASNGIEVPVKCTIASSFRDGWSYSSTDREVNCFILLMRRPKSLFTSIPGASVKELFNLHLARRSMIIQKLAAQPFKDLDADLYFRLEQRDTEMRKALMSKKNRITALFEVLWFLFRPSQEWMGDLEREAKRRARF